MGGWVSPRARPVSSGDGAPANVPAGDWRCTDRSRSWSLGCFGELRRVLRRLGSLDGRLDGEGSQNAAMRHAFRPELAGDLTETYELHAGDNVFEVRVAGWSVHHARNRGIRSRRGDRAGRRDPQRVAYGRAAAPGRDRQWGASTSPATPAPSIASSACSRSASQRRETCCGQVPSGISASCLLALTVMFRGEPSLESSVELEGEVMGEFAAAGDTELGEDCFEVVLHCVGGDVQPGGDLPGAQPGEYPADHFALSSGQSVGCGQERKHAGGPRGPDHHTDAVGHSGRRDDSLAMHDDPLTLATAKTDTGWA